MSSNIKKIIDSFKYKVNKKKEISLFSDYYNKIIIQYERIMKDSVIEFSSLNKNKDYSQLLKNTIYVPDNIKKEISNTNYDELNFIIRYNGVQIFLSLIVKISDKIDEELLYMIIYNSILVHTFRGKTIDSEIIVFLCNNKKELPAKGKTLTPENINSGLTTFYFSDKNNETIVFRREEVIKTILHEMVHNANLDYKNQIPYKNVLKYFNLNPNIELTLNESYTESIANILNSMVFSYKGKPNLKLFINNLNYEINFSLLQCAKILKHYGFKSVSDFVRPYDNKDRFKQETHVFSYFFIKTALLFSIDKLYYFLYNNSVMLNVNKNTVDDFNKLVIETILDDNFLISLQHYLYLVNNSKIDKLLRMTFIQN